MSRLQPKPTKHKKVVTYPHIKYTKIMSTQPLNNKPTKKAKVTYFGMKVTPDEKASIHQLAKLKGKSAKKVIMELVSDTLSELNEAPHRLTAAELRALPLDEQNRILEDEAKRIAKYVDVIEDGFDIVDI